MVSHLTRGNFVQHAHEGILKVADMSAKHFQAIGACGCKFAFAYEDCDGVPLTPDMLRILGFTEREHLKDLFIKYKNSAAIIFVRHNCLKVGPANSQAVTFEAPAFLHNLQNLFYLLTGEDLEIDFKILSEL